MAKGPIKLGRPSKYSPLLCDKLVNHMQMGLSFKAFGAVCDPPVAEHTLYNWTHKHPAFLQAKKIGEVLLEKHYIEMGRVLAMGQAKTLLEEKPVLDAQGQVMRDSDGRILMHRTWVASKPSAAVYIFMVRNLCGWRNAHTVEVSGGPPGSRPVQVEHGLSQAQIDARYEELTQRLLAEASGSLLLEGT